MRLLGFGGCNERDIFIFVLILRKHRGWCYSKGEGIVIPPILSWNVFNENYVNDVIMLVWIPNAELKAKA